MFVSVSALCVLFNVLFIVLNLSSNTEVYGEKVRVEVNTFLQHFTETDRALSGYNGIYNYMCEEGDFIDYTCSANDRGEMRLQYYNALGNMVIERPNAYNRYNNQLRFLKSMQIQDNNSYVDCTHVELGENFEEFTYRTVFIVRDISLRDDDIIVIINDTKLAPERSSNSDLDIHRYTFIKGTVLDITCKMKHQKAKDLMNLTMKKNMTIRELPLQGSYGLRFLVNTNALTGNKFYCSSLGKRTAEIQFFLDPYRDVFVLGLPVSGILYQYSQSLVEWRIHYEYKANEILNLQCITKDDRIPYWNDDLNDTKGIYNGMTYVTLPIVFDEAHNFTTITCYSKMNATKMQRVTIYFHQNINSFEAEELAANKQKWLIYVGYGFVVLIASISTVWACCWCTRKRKADRRQGPYENISADNPIPPFPTQWNDNEYTYIVSEHDGIQRNITNEYAGIENVKNKNKDNVMVDNPLYFRGTEPQYMEPYKSSNGHTENPYTEIDDDFKNKMKSKYPAPYEKHEIKPVPSTSKMNGQGNSSNRDLQREDSNEIYNNLFLGNDKESYVSFRNSNVLYKNIFEARQPSLNVSQSVKSQSN